MGFRVTFREHREKDGTRILYARYYEPFRDEAGKVRSRRVERSTHTGKRVDARRWAEDEYQKAYEEAHKERAGALADDTFASAARTYMLSNGSKAYLFPLIERLGRKKLSEITQTVVTNLIDKLYPGRTAATVNRQVFTPIIRVMNFAKHKHALERPKGHDSLPDLDVPKNEWYPAVLRVANPWLRAFLIVGRLHGRRPGELLNRTREHFDPELGTLQVYDAKGDQTIMLQLAGPALIALKALPDLRTAKVGAGKKLTHGMRHALFGTFRKETMRAWLKDACKEAGVRYHMAKEAGRHAFVTKNLEAGKSLKWVQDAGRWKTLKVVAEKYGHLELQEIDRQAREAGEEWFSKILSQPIQIEGKAGGDATRKLPRLGDSKGDDDKNVA